MIFYSQEAFYSKEFPKDNSASVILNDFAKNSYDLSCIFSIHLDDIFIVLPIFNSVAFKNLQNIINSKSNSFLIVCNDSFQNDCFFEKKSGDIPFYRDLEFNKKNKKKW